MPLWQELLSLVLLYLTVALMIWAAGKIYRVGILMYGKKPSFRICCAGSVFNKAGAGAYASVAGPASAAATYTQTDR